MEYFAAIFIFGIFYQLIYLAPLFIVYELLNQFVLNGLSSDLFEFLEFILLFFMLIFLVIGSYRAKIATDCRVNSSMTMGDAHRSSGAMLKTNLSFLPVIGFLFKSKEK